MNRYLFFYLSSWVVTVLLSVLKLNKAIDLSWIWVFLPVIVLHGCMVCVVGLVWWMIRGLSKGN